MKIEKDVKAKVKKLLDKHGWYWWMTPANGFGSTGIADFCAVNNGVFMAIETKFGTNKLTAMQRAYLESVNAASCFGFVVTDTNIGWLETFLEEFEAQTVEVMKNQRMSNTAGAKLIEAIRQLQLLI